MYWRGCAIDNIADSLAEAFKADGITGMLIVGFDGNPEAVQMATVFTNLLSLAGGIVPLFVTVPGLT